MNYFRIIRARERWPIGHFLVIKFVGHEQDDADFPARAAMVDVSADFKERIEKAASILSSNNALRNVQFYWPVDIITNEVYGKPIPLKYADVIRELLDTKFGEAVAESIAIDAIRRSCSLDVTTWVSVSRNYFGIGGGQVTIGCSQRLDDSTASALCLSSDTNVPGYSPSDKNDVLVALNDLAARFDSDVDKGSE